MTDVALPAIRRVLEGCGAPCVETVTAEALHRDCFCVVVDPGAVRAELNTLLSAQGASARMADAHAHLFSSLPIFVPEHTVAKMAAALRAFATRHRTRRR